METLQIRWGLVPSLAEIDGTTTFLAIDDVAVAVVETKSADKRAVDWDDCM